MSADNRTMRASNLCGKCDRVKDQCPPSLEKLLMRFPDVIPRFDIDRTQKRCHVCDYAEAKSAVSASLGMCVATPDIAYMLSAVRSLPSRGPTRAAGTDEDEDEEEKQEADKFNADVAADRAWQLAKRYQQAAMFLAAMPYFSIWGKEPKRCPQFEHFIMPKFPG